MNIISHKTAPPAIIKLIKEEYEPITVIDQVLLLNDNNALFQKAYPGKLGVFVPETGSIIVDMKACIENMQWMNSGMSFVPNVWCNLIYSVFHEGAHAKQMMEEEISFDEDTWAMQHEMLDYNADQEALEKMLDWFEINGQTPELIEMGWVGQQIQNLFNTLYSNAPDLIGAEIDILGTEAGGFAEMAAHNPYFESPESFRKMVTFIHSGDIGLKIKGSPCLRTGDLLEITALNYKEHRVAMNK